MTDPSYSDLDDLLASAAAAPALPPPGEALRRAVASGGALAPRRPAARLSILLGAAIAWAVGLSIVLGFRRDMAELPQLWFGLYLAGWLASFAALSWGSQVPARGRVMPRSALVGRLSIALALAFAIAGLALARHVPGLSTMPDSTFAAFVKYAPYCLTIGLVTASLPLLGAAFLIRGAVPVGSRWVGAAMGAASGSLGGLVLHLHCPVAERLHLGLVHGGVVTLAAIGGALLVPLIASRR